MLFIYLFISLSFFRQHCLLVRTWQCHHPSCQPFQTSLVHLEYAPSTYTASSYNTVSCHLFNYPPLLDALPYYFHCTSDLSARAFSGRIGNVVL